MRSQGSHADQSSRSADPTAPTQSMNRSPSIASPPARRSARTRPSSPDIDRRRRSPAHAPHAGTRGVLAQERDVRRLVEMKAVGEARREIGDRLPWDARSGRAAPLRRPANSPRRRCAVPRSVRAAGICRTARRRSSVPMSPCACRKREPSPCQPTMFGRELVGGAGRGAEDPAPATPISACMPRCEGSVQRAPRVWRADPVSDDGDFELAMTKCARQRDAPRATRPRRRPRPPRDRHRSRARSRHRGLGRGTVAAQEFVVRRHAHGRGLDLLAHLLHLARERGAIDARRPAGRSRAASRAGRSTPRASSARGTGRPCM